MKRKKYDSSVVMLYLLGQEDLLPKEFRRQIPASTICSWRKVDYTTYLGHEFRFFFEEHFDHIATKQKLNEAQLLLRTINKTWNLLGKQVAKCIQDNKSNRDLQKRVVLGVNFLRKSFGLTSSLNLLGINRAQYYQWSAIAKHSCHDSFASLCIKRFPRQLTLKEVQKIKNQLTIEKYEHWPIVSIAADALRKGTVVASLFTWYKYAKLLNLSHPPKKFSKKRIGLIAQEANEYLHIDTTYYYLIDNRKVCITFVMDNYTKMILGFSISNYLSFEVVKEAIQNALETINLLPDVKESYLVADGGRENNNKNISSFLSELGDIKLTQLTALKDIVFSNSPVEAIHRIMKGRYLRSRKFDSIEKLRSFLEWAVKDYNFVRPHYKHSPKTPGEMYFDTKLKFDPLKRLKKASAKRLTTNKSTSCSKCSIPFTSIAKLNKLH